jgi:hypothetical protein
MTYNGVCDEDNHSGRSFGSPLRAVAYARQADGDIVQSSRAGPERGEPGVKVSAEAGSGDDLGDVDANCSEAFLDE